MTTPFKIPRVRRSKGYRSKTAATNVTQQVSSWTYSPGDLRHAVGEVGWERREGNTATGAQAPVGMLALQLARGGRIHTRR